MPDRNVASDFIGLGIAFPGRVDHTGRLALIGGGEALDASIRMILLTAKGERPMRPEFGCAIWQYVYAPINPNTVGLMAEAVRDAIGQWEPRVILEDVRIATVEADQGRVLIDLTYRVRSTNDRRNLVFPFYVIPEDAE